MNRNDKILKYFAYIALALLLLSLIPLMAIGFYTHPLGDDYYFGLPALNAYKQSGNILSIIPAALKGTAHQYNAWQGTYSAMFLMHLPPQLFGLTAYRLFPTALIAFFVGSIFYMLKPIICHNDKIKAYVWVGIASLMSILCVEQVPVCGETFYWFNGAVYYTGYLALTFFFFGLIFRLLNDKKTYRIVLISIMAPFIAGGNYASLLPAIIVLFAVILYALIIKKDKKLVIGLSIAFALMLIGLMISVLAPGNKVRQNTVLGNSPVNSVIKAIRECIHFSLYWNGFFTFGILALITPFFIKVITDSDYDFKFAPLFIPVIFLVFCSSECPSFYGQNNGGPARLFDICFYMMIFTLFLMYFLLLGFIYNIAKKRKKDIKYPSFLIIGFSILLVTFLIMLPIRSLKESSILPNSLTAVKALVNGDAKYYEAQYQERMNIVANSEGQALVVAPLNVPETLNHFLFLGDLSDYPSYDDNVVFAEYYNLESIHIQQN